MNALGSSATLNGPKKTRQLKGTVKELYPWLRWKNLTSNQVENTLKQVGISLSRSTFRRCIEKVYNNTDYTQEQEGQISLPENPQMCSSEKKIFEQMKPRRTCT